jgi:methyltransferase (TIGR00027 family)
MAIPRGLVFAPVDFERESLIEQLEAAGFDPTLRTFFIWLGVVVYLSEAAIDATLRLIGGLAGGAEIAFDYSDPPASLSPERRAARERRAALVAAAGEPMLTNFEPAALRAKLQGFGFTTVEDLGPPALTARFDLTDGRPAAEHGGHVVFASTS